MAITIDWGTGIINVPKMDLVLIQSAPTEIRELDLNVFRLNLKEEENSVDGISFLRTHKHNTTVAVGGVVLARVIEIINGYTVTFEDGQYAVNLVGANSNVSEVVNVNQVSIRSSNSAGLQDSAVLFSAAEKIREMYILAGLELGTPAIATPAGTTAGEVEVSYAGDGINSLTVTRQ